MRRWFAAPPNMPAYAPLAARQPGANDRADGAAAGRTDAGDHMEDAASAGAGASDQGSFDTDASDADLDVGGAKMAHAARLAL
eukprot:4587396-Pyramimonas_sp.AAC.1